jgi:hypothetical protein
MKTRTSCPRISVRYRRAARTRPARRRGQHRLNLDREQVLDRLWELANLSPDRHAVDPPPVSSEKNPAPAPVNAQIYQSAWLR